jgi:5'-3' exonuclease
MYRAWFASKEQPWVAYCKFFDMMRLCMHKSRQPGVPIGVIFCGESKTILKRTQLFPEYKATRKHSKNEEFVLFRKVLERYIENLGYKMMRIDGAEADDVIASIVASTCHRCYCVNPCKDCEHSRQHTTDVVIFSGDRDLQQLLAWERVLIYRAPGLFVNTEAFEEEFGIPVKKYTIYKALIGDKSDNIAGVDGFGPVKAKTAINANSVSEDIWELGGHKASEEFKKALELVKLDTKIDIDLSDIYTGEPKINTEFFKQVDSRIIFEIKRLKEEFG